MHLELRYGASVIRFYSSGAGHDFDLRAFHAALLDDALLAESGALKGEASSVCEISFMIPGRLTRLPGYVHFIAMRRWCHRRKVPVAPW